MTTANNDGIDEFDDFDLDDISGELLDDLLRDDLEPDITPVKHPIASTARTGAINGSSFNRQQWPPPNQRTQTKISPKKLSGQQTITSMFSRTFKPVVHSHIPQKRPVQSRTGMDSIPVVPIPPLRKVPRVDDSQIQEIVDLVDLEDDYSEFVSQGIPTAQPSHVQKAHKQSPKQTFQTREIVIKHRGDNSLVEKLHTMNRDAMRTYVYPLLDGQPARAYQQGAIHRCIFQNTLVALPTGMGKTMIAVVVMANYARWFPNSLSIFLAPTRPLVAQQMVACRGMLRAILKKGDEVHQTETMQGLQLSGSWIVEMNGSTAPKSREALWNEARFVFSTPQVLQNDLKTGTLSIDNAKRISLLVIDEAHRATGKYAYGESINNLYTINHGKEAPAFSPLQPAPPSPFRVMALTATPGSKIEAVREVVQRLHIAHIYLRTEESLDVVPYTHGRQIEEVAIEMPPWLAAARDCLAVVIGRSVNLLCNVCKAMPDPGDLKRISGFQIRMNRDRFISHSGGRSGGGMDIARISSEFTVLISLAHIMQLLSEHGLRPAWKAIRSWEMEVTRAAHEMGTASRAKVQCFQSKEWETMAQEFKLLIDMLDGKQLTIAASASTGAPAGLGNRTGLGTAEPGGNAMPKRMDVVSTYFNVATKQNLAGNAVASGPRHVKIASLAYPGFLGHPKLERLVQIVRTHFEDSASGTSDNSTKIIIFSQYRGSVSEIVDVLGKVSPLVKCEQFIGQSSAGVSGNGNGSSGGSSSGSGRGRGRGSWQQSWRGRNGGSGNFRGRGRGGAAFRGGSYSKASGSGNNGYNSGDSDSDLLSELEGELGEMRGQTQKEQLAVMTRFRNGQTNVIVATCVGEEGLDIGEVDLIINYDAPSSPIRMLQRIGRTGRARRGKVVVFLAKDTREENSYKKAQREYKSVQEKIASGRGLDLRADLSPPMIPPTLSQGLPARDEVSISKHETVQDDSHMSDDSGANCRPKTRGTRKKRASTDGMSGCVGIDPNEMHEFNQLSAKYQRSSLSSSSLRKGGGGAYTPVVDRLLSRGVAWQSSVSLHCQVPHSHRSTVYRSMMQELENSRLEEMGTPRRESRDNAAYNRAPKLSVPTLAQYRKDNSGSRSVEYRIRHSGARRSSEMTLANGQSSGCKNKRANSVATNTSHTLAPNSDSDDDLDDIESVLGRSSAEKSPAALHMGFVSAGNHRPFHTHDPANNAGGKPPVSSKITNVRSETFTMAGGKTQTGSNTSVTRHKRRSSSQTGILESIGDFVKSGKAKQVFEWTVAVDDELIRMAKAQGIELGLAGDVSETRANPLDRRGSLATGSLFGDVGQPGAFDKLYDENRAIHSTASKMSESTILADAPPAAKPHVLCPESDPEDSILAQELDYLGEWAFSSLEDLQVSTPPTQPTPNTCQPTKVAAYTVDSVDTNVAPTTSVVPRSGNSQCSVSALVISDDSDLDRQLDAFDIDDNDIMILSDCENDNSGSVDTGDKSIQNPRLSQGPQIPSGSLDRLSGRTRMALNSSPPSSSPMRLLWKRQLRPLSNSFEDAEPDASVAISANVSFRRDSRDCDLSSSPISRIPKRLTRGKPQDAIQPAAVIDTSTRPSNFRRSAEPPMLPVQQQPKQMKVRKLRPPPKKARNMFIDTEAGLGDSDDEYDTGAGRRARNGVDVSEDESDDEDLNQDLSGFVVDDDHVDFTSPDTLDRSANGNGALVNGYDETPTRNSGDIYRRSLNESPITPMSEIMRRLAEREKARRWVSDTPTRNKNRTHAGPSALDLRSSKACDSDSDGSVASSEAEAEHAGSSSDFDNVEG
ncbi:3'-5' DNA helicase, partial [Coemansia sp. RSA 1933]